MGIWVGGGSEGVGVAVVAADRLVGCIRVAD